MPIVENAVNFSDWDIKGLTDNPFFFQLKNVVQLKRKILLFMSVKTFFEVVEKTAVPGFGGQQFFCT